MKKWGARLLAVVLTVVILAVPLAADASYALPDTVALSAKSACLFYLGDTEAEDVLLFSREADTRRSPGATVRMMVGLYAIRQIRAQNIDMDTATGVYTSACHNQITGSGLGVAGMLIGDEWTLRDLLTATMADTAADACVTLCTAISGSVSAFVDGMNGLAVEMGCTSTSYSNVTGLDAMGQYTTARELAHITRVAMDYPELVNMMAAGNYDVNPVVGRKQTRATVNSMLRPITDSYYPKLQFGRTGYADEAGRCMVSVAKSGGYSYMAVVMGSAGADGKDRAIAHFEDSQKLYEWAFDKFAYKTLLTAGQPVSQQPVGLAWSTDTVPLVAGDSFGTVVLNDLDISTVIVKAVIHTTGEVDAPVEKGTVFGTVELYINLDQKIGEVPLIAGASVERSEVLATWRMVLQVLTSRWLYLSIALLLLLIVLYTVLNILHNRKKRRRHKG